MELFEILKQLSEIHGPSGRENAIANAIADLAKPFVDELSVDAVGNLIAHKKGNGPRLMVTAHMDTTGLVATYVEESGMVRVDHLGEVNASQILNAAVRFENGTIGYVKASGKMAEPEMADLYVDIGASSRDDALTRVRPGDTAVYTSGLLKTGSRVMGAHLNNRISCAVLLHVMEQIQASENDLYFVFTVQEEVGLRGVRPAAFGIAPEYAVAVDVTDTQDYPGAKRVSAAALGGGAAVKVMDHSVICHPTMVHKMTELAKHEGISYQLQVTGSGSTDAGAMHETRAGVMTGSLAVPCRYMHTPAEMADLQDAEACVRLLTALLITKLS